MRSLPMARNGSENSVSIRDERGRYLKGIAGGPGRPAGSRNKLTEEFLGDLHAAWHEHGREAIDRVVAERPEVFLTRRLICGGSKLGSLRSSRGDTPRKRSSRSSSRKPAREPANCSRSLLVKWRSWKQSNNKKLCMPTASEITTEGAAFQISNSAFRVTALHPMCD